MNSLDASFWPPRVRPLLGLFLSGFQLPDTHCRLVWKRSARAICSRARWLTCRLLSPGCRETVYQGADLKRSADLTSPNRPSRTSHVRCAAQLQCYAATPVCSVDRRRPFFCAALLPGVDMLPGRLLECEALSQVSSSVSIFPTSISKQLRLFYSHQLQRPPLLVSCCLFKKKKKHPKHFF